MLANHNTRAPRTNFTLHKWSAYGLRGTPSVERPARGRTEATNSCPSNPWQYSKGPEATNRRKSGLAVRAWAYQPSVPESPVNRCWQASSKGRGKQGRGANYPSKDAVASPRAIA